MVEGFLSEIDRKWLTGEKKYSNSPNISKRKEAIREKTLQALFDFELLVRELPSEDREKIFMELHKDSNSGGVDEASFLFEFLYSGLNDLASDPEVVANYPESDAVKRMTAFRRALTNGIEQGRTGFNQSRLQEDPPGNVIIAANTDIHELPSPDDVRQEMTTDKWTQICKTLDVDQSGEDHGDVAFALCDMVSTQARHNISVRHEHATKDIKEYDPIM